MSKNKRDLIHLARTAAAVLTGLALVMMAACSAKVNPSDSSTGVSTATTVERTQAKPEEICAMYGEAWADLDFNGMYQLLSAEAKANISRDAFLARYEKITQGIEAENIMVSVDKNAVAIAGDGKSATVSFAVGMDTLAGHIEIHGYSMGLLLEMVDGREAWTVKWSEQLIFPNMGATDVVRARILYPHRGEIRDRNNQGLAVNGQLIVIGVVPGKFDAVKAEAIPKMAELLGISAKRIEKALAIATNPEWFYPIVTLPEDAGELSAQLTAIDGVQYQKASGRVYPAGAAAGLLIGYIGPITAEELEKHPDEGYTANDKIGKMGLEQVYESRLRGSPGGEIYLTAADSSQLKSQISLKEPVDGEDITLTIDSRVQAGIYKQMLNDAGAAAAVKPQTGEILALVSSPSFNPNLLQTYVPDEVQTSWNEAVKSPFQNRFKAGYAPGSVFKLVTAAIGLKTNVLDPDEALPISGLQWQPNASWGSYKVTRVRDSGGPVDLLKAFLYSDNIYFAQQALRIGAEDFSTGAAGFGIGEALPIDYPFYTSQLANKNLNNDVLLADSGYGQGEVLLSPLHVAMFYSTLATSGDIMKPVLELNPDIKPGIWKQQAIDAADVPLLTEALLQVIENPAGTGYTGQTFETRILGKTGTAELKTSQNDDLAEENGWFVAMNVEQPRLTIAMMIEDVKKRGGSHYVVPLVKQAMDELIPLLPAE